MSVNRYAVIGSNCFTGSHIVDKILQSDPVAEIYGISRSREYKPMFLPYQQKKSERNFKFYQINLYQDHDQLISLLDDIQPTFIINVAALSEVGLSNFQPVEYFQTNTLGVIQLCNALRERNYLGRYIHVSTAEVYGNCAEPVSEDASLNPSTPYAVSKAAADMYLLTLFRNFNFPLNLVRSTNVYGAHQQLYKIIPRSIIYLRIGKKIELHGGGKAVKTWVHIRDVAEGVWLILQKGKSGETYHFSDINSCTVSDLVLKICVLLGTEFKENTTVVGERLGQDAQYLLSYDKAMNKLGWKPQISFEEGLEETIGWIDKNWDKIESESHLYVHKV